MGNHQRRGRPLGKKKRVEHHGRQVLRSPSPIQPALVEDLQQTDSEEDCGKDWDPHAGTKPSPLDGDAPDEDWDPEDDADGIWSEAFNVRMVNMVSDLQDDDLRDREWKPWPEQEKKQGHFTINP